MRSAARCTAFMLALILGVLPLCACLSPVSLDACGYVISIGADRGKTRKYYFTLMLQRELSEPGTEREGGASILAAEGDTLDEAVNALEGGVPFTLCFTRTNFFIFSADIARSGDIEELLSLSFDSMKIRTSAAIVVSEGSACEFMGGLSANNDANIRKLQEAVMLDMEKTGMVALMSVSRLFEAVNTGEYDYVAAYGGYEASAVTDMEQKKNENEGKDPVEDIAPGVIAGGLRSRMKGAALFSGFRMTETLTREETELLNIACGEFKSGTFAVETGEGKTVLILTPKSLKKTVDAAPEQTPKARAELILYAGIHSKPAGMTGDTLETSVKEAARREIEEGLYNVFLKCRAAGSDAMRFGREAKKRFRSQSEWEDYCWKDRCRELEAEFSVTLVFTDKFTDGRMI